MWNADRQSKSLKCVEFWHSPDVDVAEFESITRQKSFEPGVGLPGRVWATRRPAWIPDVTQDTNFPRGPYAKRAGLHAAFGFPIVREGEVLGVMEFFSTKIEEPDTDLLEMLGAVGRQIGQFIMRKEMEQELHDSRALYQSLVETLPVNILRKDLAGRITFGNQWYCRTIGKPLPDLLGKTDHDLFPADLAEKYMADDRKVIETGQIFEDVEHHQRVEGEKFYMHVIKGPVLDAAGKVIGTQTIFWDESARHEAQEALAKTAAELRRSNRELELFAYVVSHDLQEPLRTVSSYIQLLARRSRDKLGSEGEEFIRFATDGAARMRELLNDLLKYSRVGTHQLELKPTDVGKVVEDVLANLKIAIDEAGAEVTHDPMPTAMADEVQLTQLLQNLVANAIKFRGPSKPQVHIAAVRRQPEWVFSVRDNGIGIEPQHFERIFLIFQRLHTREEYPGTGIGLAVCKKIVERHNGKVWLESQPGNGSTFFFTLAAG